MRAGMDGSSPAKRSGRDLSATLDAAALGSRIVDLRNQRGWSQRELARRAVLRPPRLSALELGRKLPQLEELAALAGALGVSLDELVFGQASRPETHELLRELEAVGTREEIAGLARLLQLLLLGYERAADART